MNKSYLYTILLALFLINILSPTESLFSMKKNMKKNWFQKKDSSTEGEVTTDENETEEIEEEETEETDENETEEIEEEETEEEDTENSIITFTEDTNPIEEPIIKENSELFTTPPTSPRKKHLTPNSGSLGDTEGKTPEKKIQKNRKTSNKSAKRLLFIDNTTRDRSINEYKKSNTETTKAQTTEAKLSRIVKNLILYYPQTNILVQFAKKLFTVSEKGILKMLPTGIDESIGRIFAKAKLSIEKDFEWTLIRKLELNKTNKTIDFFKKNLPAVKSNDDTIVLKSIICLWKIKLRETGESGYSSYKGESSQDTNSNVSFSFGIDYKNLAESTEYIIGKLENASSFIDSYYEIATQTSKNDMLSSIITSIKNKQINRYNVIYNYVYSSLDKLKNKQLINIHSEITTIKSDYLLESKKIDGQIYDIFNNLFAPLVITAQAIENKIKIQKKDFQNKAIFIDSFHITEPILVRSKNNKIEGGHVAIIELPQTMKFDDGKVSDHMSIKSFEPFSTNDPNNGYWIIKNLQTNALKFKTTHLLPWKQEDLWSLLAGAYITIENMEKNKETSFQLNTLKIYKQKNRDVLVNNVYERTVKGYYIKIDKKSFMLFLSDNKQFTLIRTFYQIDPIVKLHKEKNQTIKITIVKQSKDDPQPKKETQKETLAQIKNLTLETVTKTDSRNIMTSYTKNDYTCYIIKIREGLYVKAYIDKDGDIVDKNGNKIIFDFTEKK